jgi:hypothetical protein
VSTPTKDELSEEELELCFFLDSSASQEEKLTKIWEWIIESLGTIFAKHEEEGKFYCAENFEFVGDQFIDYTRML